MTLLQFREKFPDVKFERGGQDSFDVFIHAFVPDTYKVGNDDFADFSENTMAQAVSWGWGYWSGHVSSKKEVDGGIMYYIRAAKD